MPGPRSTSRALSAPGPRQDREANGSSFVFDDNRLAQSLSSVLALSLFSCTARESLDDWERHQRAVSLPLLRGPSHLAEPRLTWERPSVDGKDAPPLVWQFIRGGVPPRPKQEKWTCRLRAARLEQPESFSPCPSSFTSRSSGTSYSRTTASSASTRASSRSATSAPSAASTASARPLVHSLRGGVQIKALTRSLAACRHVSWTQGGRVGEVRRGLAGRLEGSRAPGRGMGAQRGGAAGQGAWPLRRVVPWHAYGWLQQAVVCDPRRRVCGDGRRARLDPSGRVRGPIGDVRADLSLQAIRKPRTHGR